MNTGKFRVVKILSKQQMLANLFQNKWGSWCTSCVFANYLQPKLPLELLLRRRKISSRATFSPIGSMLSVTVVQLSVAPLCENQSLPIGWVVD